VSPFSNFHCHLNETYNSSALLFATMFSKVLQLIWCTKICVGGELLWRMIVVVVACCAYHPFHESPITKFLVSIIDWAEIMRCSKRKTWAKMVSKMAVSGTKRPVPPLFQKCILYLCSKAMLLNYSHSRNPPCAPARTHGRTQAPREPPN
jgi:hypothetical protein